MAARVQALGAMSLLPGRLDGARLEDLRAQTQRAGAWRPGSCEGRQGDYMGGCQNGPFLGS